jgi:hypothetical protein
MQMIRWMVSPIIGTGTISDPYRASVADVSGVNEAALIPSNPDGTPKYHFALCLVATPSIALVQSVTNSYVFPDYPLDSQMSGMDAATRTALVQSVQAYDMNGSGLHLDASNADTDSYRTLITKIGQQIDTAFNPNNISCPEVSA